MEDGVRFATMELPQKNRDSSSITVDRARTRLETWKRKLELINAMRGFIQRKDTIQKYLDIMTSK